MKTTSATQTKAKWGKLITLRLVGWSAIICLVFSVVMALGECKLEQAKSRQNAFANLHKAIELFSPMLTESLWNMDTQLANKQMKALSQFDSVSIAVLTTEDGGELRFGTKPLDMEDSSVSKTLFYNDVKNLPKLGVLTLYTDLSPISQTDSKLLLHYLAFYLSISVAIASCLIIVCHLLTTKRIQHLTRTFDKIIEENITHDSPFKSQLNSTSAKDEYDELVYQAYRVWKIGHHAMKENQANQTLIQKIRTDYQQLKQSTSDKEAAELSQHQKDTQMLKSIMNALPYRIAWRDPDLIIRGANSAYLADMGIEEESSIIGTKGESFIPIEQQKLYNADNTSVLNTGYKQIDMEEPFMFPKGHSGIRIISKVPLYNERGELIGLLEYYRKKGPTNEQY
ncbi:PAS domain-containing protein [Marinomonas spartinae]|uniref:PAS domain-containing protein n=1 Tax=Marinomonas spartinae TaxID=1792290 RepID=UPI0018F1DC14|nr:PAS domain-containing protein [Marinomonas spartinae]MBJ7553875.1 PAS domain-containing protein [Marinomonas spartinae]